MKPLTSNQLTSILNDALGVPPPSSGSGSSGVPSRDATASRPSDPSREQDHEPDGIYYVLTAARSWSNECKGAGRAACVAQDGAVICFADSVEDARSIAAALSLWDDGEPRKFEAVNQQGLFFWAEEIDLGPHSPQGRKSYAVVSQAQGYPAGECHDDWFVNRRDAEALAQQFAATYPNH
jgi:hypothetical protein